MPMRALALLLLSWALPALWIGSGVLFAHLTASALAVLGWTLAIVGSSLGLLAPAVCAVVRPLVQPWTGVPLAAPAREPATTSPRITPSWLTGYDPYSDRVMAQADRWLRARTADAVAREAAWLLLAPVAVLLGLFVPGARAAVGRLAARLLGPSAASVLTSRITTLVRERSDLTQTQQAELHRLERNLHDGAQARLVSIGMTLSAVETLMDTDPDEARRLVRQARDSSRTALEELRELVRGILPPVLVERGLVDAIRALALDAPLPVTVRGALARRPEPPVESAVYFAVAELLANAVRHAGATAVEIVVDHRPGTLRVTVTDGQGGADMAQGSGLAGVASRLGWFDGGLRISSPDGGPTRVVVEVPCA